MALEDDKKQGGGNQGGNTDKGSGSGSNIEKGERGDLGYKNVDEGLKQNLTVKGALRAHKGNFVALKNPNIGKLILTDAPAP